jgi:hypothetical protein
MIMAKKVAKLVKLQVLAGKGYSGSSGRPGTGTGRRQHHGFC